MFNTLSQLFRSAFRRKGLAIMNIIGLTIAIAVSLYLITYLQFEYSYDKHFKDSDKIYRVLTLMEDEDVKQNLPINLGSLAPALVDEVPGIEYATRVYDYGGMKLSYDGGEIRSLNSFEVDSSFLNIFTFKPIYGSVENALRGPNKCVLTKRGAEKLFPAGMDPVGKMLKYTDNWYLEVEAVIENVPDNTHFDFEILVKLGEMYTSIEYYTYFKVSDKANIEDVISKADALNVRLLSDRFRDIFHSMKFESKVERLTDIHMSSVAGSDFKGSVDKKHLLMIVLITISILTIALINFVSIYILQGEERAREISIRKANGADKADVVRFLFGEVALVTTIAFAVGLILYASFSELLSSFIMLSIPAFENLGVGIWISFGVLFILTILIAGVYPAYYLSKMNPMDLFNKGTRRKYRVTVFSVVLQFSVVIFALSSMLIVGRQLRFVNNRSLGFNPDNVIVVYASGNSAKYESLKSEILQYPVFVATSSSHGDPRSGCSGQGMRNFGEDVSQMRSVDERRCGKDFLELYQIPIVEGSNFSGNYENDRRSLVVSETTIQTLGLENPIGKKIYFVGSEPYTIIGVAQDIHYKSLHEDIGRLIYSAYLQNFWTLSVKYKEGMRGEAFSTLRTVMETQYSGIPLTYIALEDIIKRQYEKDQATYNVLIGGTFVAILLSLLGLLALSGFVATQKQKEVSIRRVYGSQIDELVMGMNNYILVRVLPAIPIGVIASYFLMKSWLNGFAYSINISWWIFVIAVLITLVLATLATLFYSLKAALTNPSEVLGRKE